MGKNVFLGYKNIKKCLERGGEGGEFFHPFLDHFVSF
jgi:hypothetical protein